MKRVHCPGCDELITLPKEKLTKACADQDGRIVVVCPACGRQLKAKIKLITKEEQNDLHQEGDLAPARIFVVENAFAYRQELAFGPGLLSIGRHNKDTDVDLAIQTSDPSMDRHHCLLQVKRDDNGVWSYKIADDESRVGTFVYGRILEPKEWVNLTDTTIITLGATSLIFEPNP
ncbi:FHA domain-containing protein [Falsiporphyromonas endometrii]|uniref:FHA domain-containing protein n=1 Tax=Falsiporphyromonas endometrii TaxID=1387297 RepID=A0ABV9K634_9PORP|nr:FHA domain-containing protein [Porphyromonadaceae bacterium]